MDMPGPIRARTGRRRAGRAAGAVAAVATGLALVTTTAPGVGASTADRPGSDSPRGAGTTRSPAAPGWVTVARGLDSPRLLSWSGDGLYVAESGRGGPRCTPLPDDPESTLCLGRTGAVTRVSFATRGRPSQRRVVTGLPSVAGPEGAEATGPADVTVKGRRWWVTVGLGGTTDLRDDLGRDAARLGTVVAGGFAHRKGRKQVRAWSRISADLAAFEARFDPDGEGNDSNPTGLTWVRGQLAVTDSGGNDLLLRDRRSRLSLLSTFPTRMVPPPPFLPPGDIPMQSVPTSVVQGPGGDLYVSELTGFPFPPGEAVVWRVPAGGGQPRVHARGLTNVTDLAWYRGRLHVVQLVDDGLLSADPAAGVPQGSLRRIERDGSSTVLAEGLPAPYGVAFRKDAAYVTTCAICVGGGEVVQVPMR